MTQAILIRKLLACQQLGIQPVSPRTLIQLAANSGIFCNANAIGISTTLGRIVKFGASFVTSQV